MHGYVLKTGRRIAPFDDPVGDVPVMNVRLEDYQKGVLGRFCDQVTVVDSMSGVAGDDVLVVEDHLFFTRHFLKKALRAAKTASKPVRIGVSQSKFTNEKRALGAFDMLPQEGGEVGRLAMVRWVGSAFDASKVEALPVLPVALDEKPFVPENIKILKDDFELDYALTREGVMSVAHWTHILDIHQLALLAFWMDFSPLRVAWLLWRALTALSFNKWDLVAQVNVIGKNCDIHPTAWVGGSILGDGVSVGPYSSVFGSILGDGAKVDGHSDVTFSAIGARAIVSFYTKTVFSVMNEMSLVSLPGMQMSVLGRRAFHLAATIPMDMKLVPGNLLDVKVEHEGKIQNSGKKVLGFCLGHRAMLGAGMQLNSGLMVPNDYIIIRDTQTIVTKIPAGMASVPLELQNGVLGPVGKKRPEKA